MSGTVLVVGGTGLLGRPVARRLADVGYGVRIFSRHGGRAREMFGRAFEVAEGDVGDVGALERAMDGCVGVHVSLDGHGDWDLERRGAKAVAAAAVRRNVARITYISGASASEENAWFPMTRAKLDAERAIRDSGVGFTIFRCTMFMETLPAFVREGRAMVMGRQVAPWHWLAADDYAAMVARAFESAAAAGTTLYPYGPDALTIEEALGRYCAACAPEARVARVPFSVLSVMSYVPGRGELRRYALPLMRYFSKVREVGDPAEADALLGKPVTTLEAWCRARVGAGV
jgi:uncharacterized protein YbjT (DUF2867 family)